MDKKFFIFFVCFFNNVGIVNVLENQKQQNFCSAIRAGDYDYIHSHIDTADLEQCTDVHNLGRGEKSAPLFFGFIMPFLWILLVEQPETPLSTALWHGQDYVVEQLLKRGVKVNSQDSLGYTPLHWASGAFTSEEMYLI